MTLQMMTPEQVLERIAQIGKLARADALRLQSKVEGDPSTTAEHAIGCLHAAATELAHLYNKIELEVEVDRAKRIIADNVDQDLRGRELAAAN